MSQYLKRWRSPALSLLTVLTVFTVFANSKGFAASQPSQVGESSHYTPEQIGENADGVELSTPDEYREARNNGHIVTAWRGASDNRVWVCFDNLFNVTFGNTATDVSPTVVPYGAGSFMLLHTGVNGGIYYTIINPPPADWSGDPEELWNGQWQDVPGETTNMPVSAAPVIRNGVNIAQVQIAYRGSGTDTLVYGAWWDPSDSRWNYEGDLAGGRALSAPSVAYNSRQNTFVVLARGLDNQVWMTSQEFTSATWRNWISLNFTTIAQPNITSNVNGYSEISVLGTDNHPRFATFDPEMDQLTDWTVDTTGFQTNNSIPLVANGETIYSLITGLDGIGRWKEVYLNPGGEH
jgi:hypothetical protein